MLRRFLPLSFLARCTAACLGLLAGGCIVPPVLAPVGPKVFQPWKGLEPVSLALLDGQELGGWQCLVNEGAPLVLHLFESGGSSTPGPGHRDRYDQLADLGFSSLAFDYRGIGRSPGKRSPTQLANDTLAVYQHAVELVGGDESRVVLRASSLGTVMAADLLAHGARPGAVIAFAPVEAASIPRRYASQFWWGALYWPLAPLLKPLVETETLDELQRAECPVLVFTEPGDCFLSYDEVASLEAAAAALRLTDEEVDSARSWATSHWFRLPSMVRHSDDRTPSTECPASWKTLWGVFDLDDGAGGRWPVADILRARAML